MKIFPDSDISDTLNFLFCVFQVVIFLNFPSSVSVALHQVQKQFSFFPDCACHFTTIEPCYDMDLGTIQITL